ncbi:MAG: aminotransferase class I/II-fold pyridoxal phosphate-dependent enzyme [Fimbriimonadaceae bacterium]
MRLNPYVEQAELVSPFIAPETLAAEAGTLLRLRLGANESLFGPSPLALAAMKDAAEIAMLYGDPRSAELRTALSASLGVSPDELIFESGIDGLLSLICRSLLSAGDVAVQSQGGYPVVPFVLRPLGAKLVTVPYREDGLNDLDALVEAAHKSDAKLVYLSNPDNPSGTFFRAPEIKQFHDALPEGCMLILDEAYSEFAPPEELLPFQTSGRLIRLRTFSKAYGMAGARLGYGIANSRLVGHLEKLRMHFNLNRIAQAGALAAYCDQAYLRQVVERVAEGREFLYQMSGRLGLEHIVSSTNFVCIRLESAAQSLDVVTKLLKRGVFVRRPWSAPLDSCIRVSVAPLPMLEEFEPELQAVLSEG